jgi:peroxiredoxin
MKTIVITIFFLLVTNFTSFCQKQPIDTSNQSLIKSYTLMGRENIGKKVIAFSAFNLDGKIFSTKDLDGKITFINFWFEGCRPCLAESEALNDLYELYKCKKSFQLFSFTFESKENAQRVIKERNLKFPVLLLSYDSCNIMNFRQGYPLNIIINKEGKVSLISPGGPTDPNDAQEKFNILFKPALDLLLQKRN